MDGPSRAKIITINRLRTGWSQFAACGKFAEHKIQGDEVHELPTTLTTNIVSSQNAVRIWF